METIYKYQLQPTDEQYVYMPEGAEILTVQVQNGIPCLWAKVNPDKPEKLHHIKTYGTGHPVVDTNIKYLGSYQLQLGKIIFHVFHKF